MLSAPSSRSTLDRGIAEGLFADVAGGEPTELARLGLGGGHLGTSSCCELEGAPIVSPMGTRRLVRAIQPARRRVPRNSSQIHRVSEE